MVRKRTILALLLCIALLLSGCGNHKETRPSLNVSSIPEISLDDYEGGFTIDGVSYTPYCSANAIAQSEFYGYTPPADFALGTVLGYYATESIYHYIVCFSPADSSQWLLVCSDDGSGNLALSQAESFYRAVTVTQVPDYIENAHRLYEESIAPGSYDGPDDGLTVAAAA